jgi:hypothetical protein
MMEEKPISHQESLDLINTMINKAKDSFHDTGLGAMLWGIVIAICCLVKWAELHFDFRLPFDIFLLTFIAIGAQIYITRREKKERKAKSYDDTFMDYTWLAFGVAIFLLIHIINLMAANWGPVSTEYAKLSGHPSTFKLREFIMPLFLMLYGLPTFITGTAFKFKPMLWGGICCWVCCIVTVYTGYKVDLLLTAFSALAAWFIPGLIMMKDYKLAKSQAQKNV